MEKSMLSLHLITLFLCCFLLSGCAGKPTSVDESYNKTKYVLDEYSKTEVVEGQYVSISFGIDGGGGIRLRRVNGNYQLLCNTFSQFGWCFFEQAFDKNAGNLPFTKTTSSIGVGTTHEHFFLLISEQQIETMSKNGLDVKIYGKNRTITVDLPAIYIQGFLKKASEYSSSKAPSEPTKEQSQQQNQERPPVRYL